MDYHFPGQRIGKGIFFCWDKAIFEVELCFYDHEYVVVKGRWIAREDPMGLISVYAPTLQQV